MSWGAGALGACPNLFSVRHKENTMPDIAGDQRKTWVQGCRCLVVSSCSSCWRTC